MKTSFIINTLYLLVVILVFAQCNQKTIEKTDYTADYEVDQGKPVSVMLTAYSTTLLANGKAHTRLTVALADSLSRRIMTRDDSIRVYVFGEGRITDINGTPPLMKADTAGDMYATYHLENGICNLTFTSGTNPGKTKVEARSGKLWPGAHEIHMIPADIKLMKPTADQLPATTRPIPDMIGADISFLPQIENEWKRIFYDHGKETDAVTLLHDHGFNTIRLRLFVNPENEKSYSPAKGYCDLDHTLAMARRVKDAGMLLLLDFHYSDYWADPQQQYKPQRWENLDFKILKDSVKTYTADVLEAFKRNGVMPDMVQVGNEINHGILWPDGHIGNPDQLAALLIAGTEGAREAAPDMPVMMHIALGGQNDEAVFWLDNMIARGVQFDIIGLSYYPRWHGTLDDLNYNLRDLVKRYNKPVNVVEYGDFKEEVHDIVFNLPEHTGKGACIWEPLGPRSGLFDRDGNSTGLMQVYDSLNREYLRK